MCVLDKTWLTENCYSDINHGRGKEREMKLGQKVLAYPNTEDARIGFVITPDANADGKVGVQVGSDVFGLSLNEDAPEGNRGGTFRPLK